MDKMMMVSALLLGLMGSLHCIGMCGPIAFMLPVDRENDYRRGVQVGLYHMGRLLSYGILGALFGILGRGLYVFGLQQNLSVIVGALMVLLVLLPSRMWARYPLAKPIYRVVSKVRNRLGAALQRKSPDTFLTIGFLNGFLPCGLVYMALFGAVGMGDVLWGSVYMMLFGLGTVPLMTSAVYLKDVFKGATRDRVRRLVPVVVLLIGVFFILRGLGLGIPYVSPEPVTNLASTYMECHP